MFVPSRGRHQSALFLLSSFHIFIIAISNYLVQVPVSFFGLLTTWGTFSFPFVYLATDLTVRIFGSRKARIIILLSMVPALAVSYLISILFHDGGFQGFSGLGSFNLFVFRIALASFTAYVFGQFLDIVIFSYLRRNQRWWVAPAASTIFGNMVDTILFYLLAFVNSSDNFMAAHWPEIACVDYGFKIFVSLLLFLPVYGVFLKVMVKTLTDSGK